MKKLYAELTTECNLHCPHCNIRNLSDGFNHDEFMKQLREFDGEIVLFGGEPTLYVDRLQEVVDDKEIRKKIKSISTNLRVLTPQIKSILKDIKYIGTSWNPNRFNCLEYEIWRGILDFLATPEFDIIVMITLTEDLFNMNKFGFLNMIDSWNPEAIRAIRFEYLVADGLTQEYYDRADEWQADIYSKWRSKIPMDVENVKHWYFDCSEVYTLHPNGELVKGCPNHKTESVPEECYSCERAGFCRPCALHSYCTFPKKLAEAVKRKEEENGKI